MAGYVFYFLSFPFSPRVSQPATRLGFLLLYLFSLSLSLSFSLSFFFFILLHSTSTAVPWRHSRIIQSWLFHGFPIEGNTPVTPRKNFVFSSSASFFKICTCAEDPSRARWLSSFSARSSPPRRIFRRLRMAERYFVSSSRFWRSSSAWKVFLWKWLTIWEWLLRSYGWGFTRYTNFQ